MGKWTRLLDVYDDIEMDDQWEHLRTPGIQLVKGESSESAETARVMVVGKAPGARENGLGRPFVGRSGVVLDGLLTLAGFERAEVFITNVLKYRPPGNRTPHVGEVFLGQKALRREWAIIRPLLTICVGPTAHSAMHPAGYAMSMSASMNSGTPWEYSKTPGHWCVSEFHPEFGLRNVKMQPRMERDWEALGAWLKEWLPEVY